MIQDCCQPTSSIEVTQLVFHDHLFEYDPNTLRAISLPPHNERDDDDCRHDADGMPDGIRVNAVSPGTADTPWDTGRQQHVWPAAASAHLTRARLGVAGQRGHQLVPGAVGGIWRAGLAARVRACSLSPG